VNHSSFLPTLYAESPAWNTAGRRLFEEYMLLMAERTYLHQLNTAKEKYKYFTERFPETTQLFSLPHIAGIFAVQFTRHSSLEDSMSSPLNISTPQPLNISTPQPLNKPTPNYHHIFFNTNINSDYEKAHERTPFITGRYHPHRHQCL